MSLSHYCRCHNSHYRSSCHVHRAAHLYQRTPSVTTVSRSFYLFYHLKRATFCHKVRKIPVNITNLRHLSDDH